MRTFIVLLASLSFFVQGQQIDRAALFARVLQGESQAEDFSSDFLEQIYFSDIPLLLGQIESEVGAFESISANDDDTFTITFEKAIVIGELPLDDEGKITGFFFNELNPRDTEDTTETQNDASAAASVETPAETREESPTDVQAQSLLLLDKLFNRTLSEDDFAESFLDIASLAEVNEIIDTVIDEVGVYQRSSMEQVDFSATFSEGTVAGQIVLDAAGRIDTLLITEVIPSDLSLEGVLESFQALLEDDAMGNALVLRYQQGSVERLAEYNAQQELAVGSTFKLAVLGALQQQIRVGTHQWDDVVRLEERNRSYPSGILHNWAMGTPMTLESLASLMISRSDNTATDTLIDVVGRDAIEMYLADLGIMLEQPFLKTKEMFHLKFSTDDITDIRARYLAATKEEKLVILEEAANNLRLDDTKVAVYLATPRFLEAEWYFSATELCTLIQEVEALPSASINAGVVNVDDWQHVAFKGGSETGVLNLTTWVEKDDSSYCIVTTVNDSEHALDEDAITIVHQQMALVLR